jgi:integrase
LPSGPWTYGDSSPECNPHLSAALAEYCQPELIAETSIATGGRISEVLGLKLEHVDLDLGALRIEQRNWR